MISVHIRVLGVLTRPSGKRDFRIDCKEGISVRDLLLDLGYRGDHIQYIKVFLDGAESGHGRTLDHDCDLVLTTAAGGG